MGTPDLDEVIELLRQTLVKPDISDDVQREIQDVLRQFGDPPLDLWKGMR